MSFQFARLSRVGMARAIAVGADALQLGFLPLFAEGFLSPINAVLDIAVCIILTRLVGWHYAFLPSFILEVVPMLDIAPTWTLAILYATRKKASEDKPEEKMAKAVSERTVFAEPPIQLPPSRPPTVVTQEKR